MSNKTENKKASTCSNEIDTADSSLETSNEIQGSRKSRFMENLTFLNKEFRSRESMKYLVMAALSIVISIVIAFVMGQLTFPYLESNASNAGHIYGIMTSSIAFFLFARYLRQKKDILYVRTLLVIYFIGYACCVMLILLFLQQNIVYFLSTTGNALILFSAYTLIIFIINPDILGVIGLRKGVAKRLFLSGQHVRLILIYLAIVLMQIFGFSLLNLAIYTYSGGTAFKGFDEPGTWMDFIYLSTITFVTIGYGDITPITPVARLSAIVQALLSHIISILFIAVLLLYLSSATSSGSAEPVDAEKIKS
jgi:hypothetical protein